SAELNHPGRRRRRRSENREVVLVRTEDDAATAASRAAASRRGTSAARTASRSSSSPIFQHLVTVHDVRDFLVAVPAQHGGEQPEGGRALRRCHVAETKAVALI